VGGNNKLRNSIYQYALEPSLLGLVGKSQMQKEIEKTVQKITQLKYELEMDTEQPIEFDEKGLKQYLSNLVTESEKRKRQKSKWITRYLWRL
jgi:hypothetical protein